MAWGKLIFTIVIVAILWPRIRKIVSLHVLDYGEPVIPHKPGKCARIQGIGENGAEDMAIVPGTDVVIMSSGLIFGHKEQFPDAKGMIVFYDLSQKNPQTVTAKFKNYKSVDSINPHGISVWKDSASGKVVLFVVNHDLKFGELVERFEVDLTSHTLIHLESIHDSAMMVVNDIVAVGEREFYFTNTLSNPADSLLGTVQLLLIMRTGNVCHFGPKGVTVVESGLLMPNGINASPDNRYLYVSHMGDFEVRVYDISHRSDAMFVQARAIPSFIDNINVDPLSGDLWIGAHPVPKTAMHYLQDRNSVTAPSQVLKVGTKNGLLTDDLVEVYVDDGKVIEASSVALYHQGDLLIGSVCNTAVHCKVLAF